MQHRIRAIGCGVDKEDEAGVPLHRLPHPLALPAHAGWRGDGREGGVDQIHMYYSPDTEMVKKSVLNLHRLGVGANICKL